MQRKFILSAAFSAAILASPAMASGNHAGGHDDFAAGKPAGSSVSARTVKVTMQDDGGDMQFRPSKLKVRRGETLRLVITNKGQVAHEFVMDHPDGNQKHKALMEKFPEMEHDDPNSIRLEPGKSGEIVWTFSKAGTFEFACLIPGHYDSGMHGPIEVSAK